MKKLQIITMLLCSVMLCSCSNSSEDSKANNSSSSLAENYRKIQVTQAESEPDEAHLEYVREKIGNLSDISITDISDRTAYIEVTVPDKEALADLEDTLLADKTDMDGIMIHTEYPSSENEDSRKNIDDVLNDIDKLSEGIKVISAADHSSYAEIIVYDHDDVKALEDKIQDSGYSMNGIMVHICYDHIVAKPNLSGKPITDIETVQELISKYKNDFKDPRVYEEDGSIIVELNWQVDLQTLEQYLTDSDVDMSIVKLVKPERYST